MAPPKVLWLAFLSITPPGLDPELATCDQHHLLIHPNPLQVSPNSGLLWLDTLESIFPTRHQCQFQLGLRTSVVLNSFQPHFFSGLGPHPSSCSCPLLSWTRVASGTSLGLNGHRRSTMHCHAPSTTRPNICASHRLF